MFTLSDIPHTVKEFFDSHVFSGDSNRYGPQNRLLSSPNAHKRYNDVVQNKIFLARCNERCKKKKNTVTTTNLKKT